MYRLSHVQAHGSVRVKSVHAVVKRIPQDICFLQIWLRPHRSRECLTDQGVLLFSRIGIAFLFLICAAFL